MLRYASARLAHAAVIVFFVASLTFLLVHLAPGDPFTAQLRDHNVSPDVEAEFARQWGLDRPLPIQYLTYLANVARGDLGPSFAQQRPAAAVIVDALPNTVALAIAALAVNFTVGITVGSWQGTRAGSRLDHLTTLVTLGLFSMPVFWLGLMALLVFGQQLGWFPIGGATTPATYSMLSFAGKLVDRVHHLVLPALTLGLVGAAATARFHRSAMFAAVREDFVRAARARGLPERAVLYRHALRNALVPAVTLLGLSLPVLFSGSLLVEQIFAWPGMGRAAFQAIEGRDYNVVTAAAVVAALAVVVGNLVADLLHRTIDPRTRSI